MPNKVLTVIIPAFNEEQFIGALLEQVRMVDLGSLGYTSEIIVIDDGSTDETASIARSYPDVIVDALEINCGKGEAVKRGIELANGELIIIQDADLEYDPGDYILMLEAMERGGVDAVYGSRYLDPAGGRGLLAWYRGRRDGQSWRAYLGGRSLSFVAYCLTGAYLTDTVTALKLFKSDVIKSLTLVTTGFELDHEITSLVLAKGLKITEVPVHYYPRSKAEGKKIGLSDWLTAIRTYRRFGAKS